MKKQVVILLLVFVNVSFGINPIDSLFKVFNSTGSKNLKIETEARISWEYRAIGDYVNAIKYAESALEKAKKEHFDKGMADAYNALGAVYDEKGNYPKSLDNYLKSLKIHEKLKDEKGICRDLNNIGLLYENLNNYNTALSFYERALIQAQKMNDEMIISAIYFNMGAVYTYKEEYDKSTEYYLKSMVIDEKLHDDLAISDCYVNLGINASYLSQFDKAIVYSQKGLEIKKQLNDLNGVSSAYYNIGDIYSRQQKYAQALDYYQKALEVSLSNGIYDNTRLAYAGLSTANFNLGKYKEAYIFQVKFKEITDSIFNATNNEVLNKIKIDYELEKKQTEQEKLQALSEADKKKQRVIIVSVLIMLLMVSIFSISLYKRFKITNKQKEIISHQKELVDEKQKEIIDSINYAKRIQYSLLASVSLLEKNLTDYFLYFKPKDVVSGDFYWASELSNGNFALVTADSTGHGVPGAIMSMLNISCLNEAVNADKLLQPADILNATRRKIIQHLSNDGSEQGGKDGMDCNLISFDKKNRKMTYSAANNPIWIVRNRTLQVLVSDRMPVGKHDKDTTLFSQHEIDLMEGDIIYAFTDGYPDQFGGPKGKKFKYSQLQELLISISDKDMRQQKDILNLTLEQWKGELEQVDDVLIIGFKM